MTAMHGNLLKLHTNIHDSREDFLCSQADLCRYMVCKLCNNFENTLVLQVRMQTGFTSSMRLKGVFIANAFGNHGCIIRGGFQEQLFIDEVIDIDEQSFTENVVGMDVDMNVICRAKLPINTSECPPAISTQSNEAGVVKNPLSTTPTKAIQPTNTTTPKRHHTNQFQSADNVHPQASLSKPRIPQTMIVN